MFRKRMYGSAFEGGRGGNRENDGDGGDGSGHSDNDGKKFRYDLGFPKPFRAPSAYEFDAHQYVRDFQASGKQALGPQRQRQKQQEEESSWQVQMRELREAKAAAREKLELQQQKEQREQNEQTKLGSAVAMTSSGGAGGGRGAQQQRSSLLLLDSGRSGSSATAVAAASRGLKADAGVRDDDDNDDDDDSEDERRERKSNGNGVGKRLNWQELLRMSTSLPLKKLKEQQGPGQARSSSNDSSVRKTNQDLMNAYLASLAKAEGGGGLGAAQRWSKAKLPTIADSIAEISIDPLIKKLLMIDLSRCSGEEEEEGGGKGGAVKQSEQDKEPELEPLPVRFLHEAHYIKMFWPLLLLEVKAALIAHVSNPTPSPGPSGRSYGGSVDASGSSGSSGSSGYRNVSSAASATPPLAASAVKVRCVLCNARIGQPSLQEVHVMQISDTVHHLQPSFYSQSLKKDELVVLLHSPVSYGTHVFP
jgi:hypothetical protein